MNRVISVIFGITFGLSTVAFALPGATGIAPAAGSTVSLQPTFTWTPVGGATWYRIWANPTGAGANQLFCKDAFYGAGRVDPGGCWIQGGTTHIQIGDLTPGSWKWFIHAWSSSSRGADWSPGISFTVAAGPPPPTSGGMARGMVSVTGATTPIMRRSWNSQGGTPTVSRISTGVYAVRFPGFANMSSSFWSGVVGKNDANTSNGSVTIQPLAPAPADGLFVQTFDGAGVATDQPFYIIVH
jgi:hypothetical protein